MAFSISRGGRRVFRRLGCTRRRIRWEECSKLVVMSVSTREQQY